MNLKPERLAIILEAVSFFLVTLDLFGKERIEGLQGKFEIFVEKIKTVDIQNRVNSWLAVTNPSENRFYPYLYALIFLALSAGVIHILRKLGAHWFVWVVIAPIWLGLGFRAVRSITFLSLELFHLVIEVSEKMLDGSFTFILLLFRRFKFGGVMLVVGTVLFVFSKVISFVYVE